MSANNKQVDGTHYQPRDEGRGATEQHWDRVWKLYGRGYFVGCATKYIERYHLKNGRADLEKAKHFLEKLIELEYPEQPAKLEPIRTPLPTDFTGHYTEEGHRTDGTTLFKCLHCGRQSWLTQAEATEHLMLAHRAKLGIS